MNKAKIHLIINIISFLAFLISLTTGIMLWLKINLSRQILMPLHTYSSLIFSALIIIHVLLHYNWIKAMLKR